MWPLGTSKGRTESERQMERQRSSQPHSAMRTGAESQRQMESQRSSQPGSAMRTGAEMLGDVSLTVPFFADKVGECPRKRLECRNESLSSCKTDFNCEAHFKCCHFACGKKCMDPYEGTGIQVGGGMGKF